MRETQLWPFSQPQPSCVVTHKGRSAPYQLHCSPPLPEEELLELDELLDEVLELEELELLEEELELELLLDEELLELLLTGG